MTRGKGEGSIYKRPDGKWVAALDLPPGPTGRRRRKALYGATRREVMAKLDRARLDLTGGQEPQSAHDQRVTIGQLLTEWLASLNQPGASQRALTASQYAYEANARLMPQLGHIPIAQLDHRLILRWQADLLRAGFGPRSVLKARTILAAVIRLARLRRPPLLRENPLELVPAPRAGKPNKRALSGDEAGCLLRAIIGSPMETLLLAALLTGARRGELLGWTWADVDLDAATVRMRHQVQRINHQGLQMVEPKTDAGARVVPLPSLLVERLRSHQAEQLAARASARRWANADPVTGLEKLVFTGRWGGPIEPRNFNRQFTALIKSAGLAPLTPHELRHSASTILLVLGVPPLVVAQLLGHADPSVTLRWYSHVVPDAHREAMARMDDYIRRIADEHSRAAEPNGYTNGVTAADSAPAPSSHTTARGKK